MPEQHSDTARRSDADEKSSTSAGDKGSLPALPHTASVGLSQTIDGLGDKVRHSELGHEIQTFRETDAGKVAEGFMRADHELSRELRQAAWEVALGPVGPLVHAVERLAGTASDAAAAKEANKNLTFEERSVKAAGTIAESLPVVGQAAEVAENIRKAEQSYKAGDTPAAVNQTVQAAAHFAKDVGEVVLMEAAARGAGPTPEVARAEAAGTEVRSGTRFRIDPESLEAPGRPGEHDPVRGPLGKGDPTGVMWDDNLRLRNISSVEVDGVRVPVPTVNGVPEFDRLNVRAHTAHPGAPEGTYSSGNATGAVNWHDAPASRSTLNAETREFGPRTAEDAHLPVGDQYPGRVGPPPKAPPDHAYTVAQGGNPVELRGGRPVDAAGHPTEGGMVKQEYGPPGAELPAGIADEAADRLGRLGPPPPTPAR